MIDQFRCGLRDDVQDLLLTLADPSSFNEAITQAIRCDNRLFERHQEKKVTSNAQLWNSRPATLPLVPQTTPVARPASFGPTLMQIDASKFKPLIEAEKLRRRTNNLCLYCGNPGHIARQCPQKLVKLQVQAVETPKSWKTRTSSHSRSRATRSHPTPPLQRLLFRCWSQSQFHSVCGHHLYSRRHTTSVNIGGLWCHLFFHRPNICRPTQHPYGQEVNPYSCRGY